MMILWKVYRHKGSHEINLGIVLGENELKYEYSIQKDCRYL